MDIDTHNELETKAGIPLDAVVTHGEMMRAFEAFKETNDQRLAATSSKARPHQLSGPNVDILGLSEWHLAGIGRPPPNVCL